MSIKGYEIIKELGKGAFGTVYKTKNKETGEICCTKVMEKKQIKKSGADKYAERELAILKEIKHPNCLKFIDSFDDKKNIYLTTEFIDGASLDSLIEKQVAKNNEGFSEKIVQHVMKGILEGLKYLHENKILHRDLKPDNIMIAFNNEEDKNDLNLENSEVKIVDFGFARHISDKEQATSNVGSAPYKDPGLLLRQVYSEKKLREVFPFEYDQKVDIWSLGILCYELLTGVWTFDSDDMKELYTLVNNGEYTIPLSYSKEFALFINSMLIWEYNDRASAEDLLKHPFITKKIDEFEKLDPGQFENEVRDNSLVVNAKTGLKIK